MDWKFVLVLIFSLLVAVFTMQNAEAVDISFLGFEFTQVSQAFVILISAVAGALIVLLFSAIRWVKDKSRIMVAKRSIAALETQVKLLQTKLDAEVAKNAPPAIEEKGEAPIQNDPGDQPETQTLDSKMPSDKENTEEPAAKRKWFQR